MLKWKFNHVKRSNSVFNNRDNILRSLPFLVLGYLSNKLSYYYQKFPQVVTGIPNCPWCNSVLRKIRTHVNISVRNVQNTRLDAEAWSPSFFGGWGRKIKSSWSAWSEFKKNLSNLVRACLKMRSMTWGCGLGSKIEPLPSTSEMLAQKAKGKDCNSPQETRTREDGVKPCTSA